MFLDEIPDYPLIQHLQHQVWSHHAAVFVGSGFSRNATKRGDAAAPMPTWWEVSSRLATEMGKAKWDGNFLRLGSQYEALYGRGKLTAFLEQSVPDHAYAPGPLHELLLHFPWQDVFTTNWDTLLEGARPKVLARKYDLIVASAYEIPRRERPRIVKLHGSFGSGSELIFTEEDFRTYPRKYAPLVNLVQQSLMENTLCLLGFSADDPNFLQWTGWVRDNLGQHAPKIYLCGLLDLDPAHRAYLTERNIVPVDLSPLFPKSRWPNSDDRHSHALEVLLLSLARAKPSPVEEWLEPKNGFAWKQARPQSLPFLRADEAKADSRGGDPHATPLEKRIPHLTRSWREQRLRYPGWLVAPNRDRNLIWYGGLNFDFDHLLEAANKVTSPLDLAFAFEAVWRLEVCCIPLFAQNLNPLVDILKRYNPFPWLLNEDQLQGAATPENHARLVGDEVSLDWHQAGDYWVHLMFAVMREARLWGDDELWAWADGLLGAVVNSSRADWQASLCYERCLDALVSLDEDKVRAILAQWPEQRSFWDTRKASVLAEIAEWGAAHQLALQTLEALRKQQMPGAGSHRLWSEEAATLSLARFTYLNRRPLSDEYSFFEESYQRIKELGKLDCDPYVILDEFMRGIQADSIRAAQPRRRRVKGFDPGAASTTTTWGSSLDDNLLGTLKLIRLLERGVYPVRGLATEPGEYNSILILRSVAPLLGFSMFMRSNAKTTDKFKERYMSREHVARLSPGYVDHYFDILLQLTQRTMQKEHERTSWAFNDGFVDPGALFEILSRLAFRLTEAQFDRLFELCETVYRMGPQVTGPASQEMGNLLRRMIEAMPKVPQEGYIVRMLGWPIHVEAFGWWPEPFPDIRVNPAFRLVSLRPETIKSLVEALSHPEEGKRDAAYLRLLFIHRYGGLNSDQEAEVARVIWAGTGDLPPLGNIPAFSTLVFPGSTAYEAQRRLRIYLLSKDTRAPAIHREGDSVLIDESGHTEIFPYFREILATTSMFSPPEYKLDWPDAELKTLVAKLIEWTDRAILEYPEAMQHDPLVGSVSAAWAQFGRVMGEAVLPALKEKGLGDEETATALLNLHDQVPEIIAALPAVLLFQPDELGRVYAAVWSGVVDNDPGLSLRALIAIILWAVLAHRFSGMPPLPEALLAYLVWQVFDRRDEHLENCLTSLSAVIKYTPHLIGQELQEVLSQGLGKLEADTRLPMIDYQNITEAYPSAQTASLPMGERPALRWRASELAALASVKLEHISREVIRNWRNAAAVDTLPEVRQPWTGEGHAD